LILYSRPLCHTLSKAWLTSRNTAAQYFLSSRVLLMILYICILSHIATSLSLFFPSFVRLIDDICHAMNLLYGRMPSTKSELVMWDPLVWPQVFVYSSKYKFSKTLDNTDRRLIGRYEAISVGSFPGLTIVIICEIALFYVLHSYFRSQTLM
jgi:hypothetical protein